MIALGVVIFAPSLMAAAVLLLRKWSGLLAVAGAALSLVGSFTLLAAAISGTPFIATLPGLPGMPLLLEASQLTAVLSLMVSTVAIFVMIFAVGYMDKDPEKPRFFATMLMFVAAMQLLVLSADWITLLAAWEMIGVSSYLLIGFWHGRPKVAGSATRAFLYTRSADLGLYIGIFILIGISGTSQISTSLATTGTPAIVGGLLLLVAAMGKSAQVPLNDWLQRAMAGPTPVSALLHSATLVAAGAILLIRIAPMLPEQTLIVIGLVGGITSVVTGLIALGEKDLKRLLAASTSSQYGLMLLAIGAGAWVVALLHLIAHAAIKSGLFLGAGVFQHSRGSTLMSDIAGAGREHKKVFAGFALAALALAGIPPLVGFFSKDAIIAAAMSAPGAVWLLPLGLAATVLTGAYMARAVGQLWRGSGEEVKPNSENSNASSISPDMRWMGIGMAGPVFLAIVLGVTFVPLEEMLGKEPELSTLAMAFGLGAAVFGLLLGWFFKPKQLLGPLLGWAQNGFIIAGGMDNLVVRPAMAMARACNVVDQQLYNLALKIGNSMMSFARGTNIMDIGLYAAVLAFGNSMMSLGRVTRFSDEKGIDGAIFGFASITFATGKLARLLQSGLIHRELALSIIATGILAVGLIAAPMLF
ncbi:MAG: NADH-quinone oxidoreductase subunit L [Devosiaceae bacterium]|nr:NADH-quinone oxidoreductase subunit L [Devosiaceae bacterium]